MFFGTLGGIVTGASIPLFNVLFGKMLDNLNDGDPNSFQKGVNDLALIFVYVAIANIFSGLLQVL
jgi:hypothetical protein